MKITERLREQWKKEIIEGILNILENSELATYDVNRELGIHHVTAKKYLTLLERRNFVIHRKVSGADLWSLRR